MTRQLPLLGAEEDGTAGAGRVGHDTLPGEDAEGLVALLSVHDRVRNSSGAGGSLLLLMVEAGLDGVQHVLELLATQGANVLGGSAVDVGHADVDELTGNGLDADVVAVALRKGLTLGSGLDDLDRIIAAETSCVERLVVERQVGSAEILLHLIGDAVSAGASISVSMYSRKARKIVGNLRRIRLGRASHRGTKAHGKGSGEGKSGLHRELHDVECRS